MASVEEVLRRNAGAYQLIYLHRLSNALAYGGLAGAWCPSAHVVYSVADLHHVRMARQAGLQERPKLLARAQSTKRAELLAMRMADAVITHSPAEAAYLAGEVPGARVHVVPWPVAARASNMTFRRRKGIAFIGSVGHDPNVDAVLWLLDEIMPQVWRRDSSILCRIVGAGWKALLKRRPDKRVLFVGAVPDLATLFDKARLTVAPLRFGAGIKGKVLDSFAAGVPCVMTPVAAEGLPLTPVLNNLVRHSAEELAELILRLHGDEPTNAETAAAGLSMIGHGFGFKRVKAELQTAVQPTKRAQRRSA
jgi:glycosyltransferase involved in cell wall biosynthesis